MPTSDSRGWRSGLALLRERDFSRLFFARLVSAFGTSMAFVALPFGVLELVGAENPEPVGWVIASATGSQLLFQLFGGALADRGSRQRMFSVLWNTALHTRVEPKAISRVSAYDAVGSMALAPVGEVFAGTLVAEIRAPSTLTLAVWMIVLPSLLVLVVPEVRQLRDATGSASYRRSRTETSR